MGFAEHLSGLRVSRCESILPAARASTAAVRELEAPADAPQMKLRTREHAGTDSQRHKVNTVAIKAQHNYQLPLLNHQQQTMGCYPSYLWEHCQALSLQSVDLAFITVKEIREGWLFAAV